MIAFVFDLETTGIPSDRKATFRNLNVYDGARIVSIAWRLIDTERDEELKCRYYVIRPDGFMIPEDSIAIHGISNEEAMEQGVPFKDVVDELSTDIDRCSVMVAHNIMFDINILRSELFRLRMQRTIDSTFDKEIFCTMRESRNRKIVSKFTKLTDLYHTMFPEKEECTNAHNAMYDVNYCCDIYKEMMKDDDA